MHSQIKKTFHAEITYQPINDTYSVKIEEGNKHYFEVDNDLSIAVDRCTKRYVEAIEKDHSKLDQDVSSK